MAVKPDSAEAYFDMGRAHARLKQYSRAIDAWHKCVDVDPAGPLAKKALELIDSFDDP